MADSTTERKTMKFNDRQRIEVQDIEDTTILAEGLDKEDNWSLICDKNKVIGGYNVTHSAGRTFYIGEGQALYEGEVLKDTGTPQASAELDENTDPSDERIDIVYIDGPSLGTDDSASRAILSAITRTDEAAEAVGTGDGLTTTFDLAYSGVDPDTLQVQVDGTPVGGWDLSPGTAGGGEDQIIFANPPGNTLAITADYTRQSGGAESMQSVPTRYTKGANISVEKGTPGDPAPTGSLPSGAIQLAHITVPASWTGGFPTEIDNSVKSFMLHEDKDAKLDSSAGLSSGVAPNAGKLWQALRHISQVLHGYRVKWESDSQVIVTPGWGVQQGVAFRDRTESLLGLQDSDNLSPGYVAPSTAAWYQVVGKIQETDSAEPGSALLLDTAYFSTSSVDSRRDIPGVQGIVYLGSIYVDNTSSITIRKFYTHGDWVFWDNPSNAENFNQGTRAPGVHPVTVTEWCPPTGRLLYVEAVDVYAGSTVVGDTFTLDVQSHKDPSALGAQPDISIKLKVQLSSASETIVSGGVGFVRAEDDGGARKIKYSLSFTGVGTQVYSGDIKIKGYLDDYRTMDDSGAPSTY